MGGVKGKLAGFWDACCVAIFSYTGNEVVGILADETERQRDTLPTVVRRISYRIVPFYVLATLALGIAVSVNDPILQLPLSQGPIRNYPGGFIVMVERAGISGLPHVINLVMILAAWSTATADLYITVVFIQFLLIVYRVDLYKLSRKWD